MFTRRPVTSSGLAGSSAAFQAGERVERFSMLALFGNGIVELFMGFLTGSVGLTADGVDSLSDGFVSTIVWAGLRFSHRRPDDRFHFGYYKVENLAALFASIGMVGAAILIMYQSYLGFVQPHSIGYAPAAMVVVLAAGTVSVYRTVRVRRVAAKYGLLSLRTDASNSLKDCSSSFIIFASLLGSYFGLRELDAVGGMIISLYIFGVAYTAIRESSMILLDAVQNPELVSVFASALSGVEGVRSVGPIRLRLSGPYVLGISTVRVDPQMTVERAEEVRQRALKAISEAVENARGVSVVVRPAT